LAEQFTIESRACESVLDRTGKTGYRVRDDVCATYWRL